MTQIVEILFASFLSNNVKNTKYDILYEINKPEFCRYVRKNLQNI